MQYLWYQNLEILSPSYLSWKNKNKNKKLFCKNLYVPNHEGEKLFPQLPYAIPP
jgi:hypothetical protein